MLSRFPECLIELEPMVRTFDEIDILEAVLKIKRAKVCQDSFTSVFFFFTKLQGILL